MNARTIGRRLFTDGVTRPGYEDEHGQFIVEDGERIDGVWYIPPEECLGYVPEPLIVRTNGADA